MTPMEYISSSQYFTLWTAMCLPLSSVSVSETTTSGHLSIPHPCPEVNPSFLHTGVQLSAENLRKFTYQKRIKAKTKYQEMGRVSDVVWESLVHPTCLCIPCRLGSLQFKGQGYLRELEFPIPSLPHKALMKKEVGGKCFCFSSLGWGSCSLLLAVSHQFCHYSKKGKILKLSSWTQGTAGVIQALWAPWLALISYCFMISMSIIFGSFEKFVFVFLRRLYLFLFNTKVHPLDAVLDCWLQRRERLWVWVQR